MKVKVVVFGAIVAIGVPVLVIAAHSDSFGCDSCHTPHHSDVLVGVPLWSGNEGQRSWSPDELYSSDTLDAVIGQPDGASKLCLSCHDGANPLYGYMIPSLIIDDLANTHPISFIYDKDLATTDGGLKDPDLPSGLGGTIADDLLDPDSKVQCSSCHDVHISGVGANLLRGMDYFQGPGGGELCRMCHLK